MYISSCAQQTILYFDHTNKKVKFTMMNQLFYTVRIVHGHSKQLKCKYFVNFKSSFHRLSLS